MWIARQECGESRRGAGGAESFVPTHSAEPAEWMGHPSVYGQWALSIDGWPETRRPQLNEKGPTSAALERRRGHRTLSLPPAVWLSLLNDGHA
jgi:hypothetical protein